MTFNRVPVATYRLQFNKGFGFAAATEICAYLAGLGVSDIYASPLFRASPESTHGYDVCGIEINPNLGTKEDFDRFLSELRRCGLGLLLDIVPNHMSADWANVWWRNVLEKGEESRFAKFFDVKWEAREDRKILLPVLGDRYAEVLSRAELRLELLDGKLVLRYGNRTFPLSARSNLGPIHSAKSMLRKINESRETLHQILEQQHYRLAYWRAASHEINYRRFFDVTDLVCLRAEDEDVFRETHRLVFELVREGGITGLRVDHVDGLRDPKTYFDRLQAGFRQSESSAELFIVAEKILSGNEKLPNDWAVAGTTGYDFLVCLNGLFIAAENENAFTKIYSEFTGITDDYKVVAHWSKKEVLKTLFSGEVSSLTVQLKRIAEQTVEGFDFTLDELQRALVEFIAAFLVYRTYDRPAKDHLSAAERQQVREAVQLAVGRHSELAPVLRFLERVLTERESLSEDGSEFILGLQQFTGPVTAKGLEDTGFYRYNRFVSLNEVGGNPAQFGTSVDDFHRANLHRHDFWPHSLLATATHDTKRGEDVRARLNVLSEIPAVWETLVRSWCDLNKSLKTEVNGQLAPCSNDEYLLYQTLIGTWDNSAEGQKNYDGRIQQYMLKAIREAKVHTSWTDQNSDYENATARFVDGLLHHEMFLQSFKPFQARIAYFGVFNSVSQLLLKICSPGVPDFYQGSELWDLNLVDPDNRRPVDYNSRRELLSKIRERSQKLDRHHYVADLLKNSANPELKMFVMWIALGFRTRNKGVFESGEYIPLPARGEKAPHIVAFARRLAKKVVAVVAPRLPLSLVGGSSKPPIEADVWADTELPLPPGPMIEVFSQTQVNTPYQVGRILRDFPIALLETVG